MNIQICPHCGQPQSISKSPVQVSSWTSSFALDHELSCFCYSSRKELEKLHEMLSDKLLGLMKEHFPEVRSLEELCLEVDKMERDDPFRTEMSYRIGYLRRLKERFASMPDAEKIQEMQKQELQEKRKLGLHGRPQSMKDWMSGGR